MMQLQQNIRKDNESLRKDLNEKNKSLRKDLNEKNESLRKDNEGLREQMGRLRIDVQKDLKENLYSLRNDMEIKHAQLEQNLKETHISLRSDIEESTRSLYDTINSVEQRLTTDHELKINEVKRELQLDYQKMRGIQDDRWALQQQEIENRLSENKVDTIKNIQYEVSEQITENFKKLEAPLATMYEGIAGCKQEITYMKTDFASQKFIASTEKERSQKEREEFEARMIQTIKENIEKEKSQYNMNAIAGGIVVTCNGGQTETSIPKYSGRTANPNEYLRKLQGYMERNKYRKWNGQEMNFKDILDISLEGTSNRWWEIHRNEIETYEDFEREFLNRYWNSEIQSSMKRKIATERYRLGGRLTRAEYFLEKVILLQDLKPRPTEEEIVGILATHYDQRTRDAKKVQNLRTIRDFENYLSGEDIEERCQQTYYVNKYEEKSKPEPNTSYGRRNSRNSPDRKYNQNKGNYQERSYQNWKGQDNYYKGNRKPYERQEKDQVQRNYRGGPINYIGNYKGRNYQPRYHNPNRGGPIDDRREYRHDRGEQNKYPTPEQRQICQIVAREEERPPDKKRRDGEGNNTYQPTEN